MSRFDVASENVAFQRPNFLSIEQLTEALSSFAPGAMIELFHICYKNGRDIRRSELLSIEDLRSNLLRAMEDGRGRNLEVVIPALGETLVCHHDGVCWLHPPLPKQQNHTTHRRRPAI